MSPLLYNICFIRYNGYNYQYDNDGCNGDNASDACNGHIGLMVTMATVAIIL